MKNILGKKADYISPEIVCVLKLTENVLVVSGSVGSEEFDNVENSIDFGI